MANTFLAVAYLAPVLIGIIVGALVFGGLRAMFGKPQPNTWLRVYSAVASAVLSGLAGLVMAGFIAVQLSSLHQSTADGMKLTLLAAYIFAVVTTESTAVGAVIGSGPWRSTARPCADRLKADC